MNESIRKILAALWPLIEWALNKSIDLLEWLANEHEDWFDRLISPLIKAAV